MGAAEEEPGSKGPTTEDLSLGEETGLGLGVMEEDHHPAVAGAGSDPDRLFWEVHRGRGA